MNSIFQRSNPAIEKIFADAGSPKKVMCVPIDYAKRQHTALVCNGEGMQLRGAFNIHNTTEGVDFLEDIIKGLCKKHSIRREYVFFGGEDCTAFCYNFIHALLNRDYLGIGINAYEGAEARQNQLASTDKLDLLGIASVLINKKRGRTLSTEYGQARRLLRICAHLLHKQDFYLPSALRQQAAHEDRKAYYAKVWDPILIKWRNAGAIQQAFADGAPLEQWRLMLNDLYNLNLSKLSPQYERLRDR